jgi:hypothetical protein
MNTVCFQCVGFAWGPVEKRTGVVEEGVVVVVEAG